MATAVHVPTMTKARARQPAKRRARRLPRLDARRVRFLHPHARHRRHREDRSARRGPTIALTLTLSLGDATDRRDHLRHHGRSLRPPAAADDQRRLLCGDFGAVGPRAQLSGRSWSCACCSASAWAANGASARRSRSSRRRRACAALLSGCCRRATRSAICSPRSRSVSLSVLRALVSGKRLAPDVLSRRPARRCSRCSSAPR